jgi:hypothetical protein
MVATDDVGRTAAELLLEDWSGHRVVEVEGSGRCHVVEAPTRSGLLRETSNGRSDLAPRGHRRGAKHAVRLG